jgi:micrococcal nuclease
MSPVASLAPIGATETARVVRVVDGDTIVIDRGRGNERVRYIGMDTPESVKPNTPVQFMAKEASAANEALVAGRDVVLERDVSNTDQYDRLLRYVWLRDGGGWVFVNLELVRQGYAQVATYPPDVRWTDTFLAAQRVARGAGLGLWGPVTAAP